jgi:hypothetical protein
MIPACVLAIDGGGMTGLAWLWEGGTAFYADEYEPLTAADHIEATCAAWGPGLAIVWEAYKIRVNLPQTNAYDAIGINMAARWRATRHHCQIQPPAQQHTPVAAEHKELEAIGWWIKGKNDAQSAAWHLMHWLEQTGNLPPREREILSAVRTTI